MDQAPVDFQPREGPVQLLVGGFFPIPDTARDAVILSPMPHVKRGRRVSTANTRSIARFRWGRLVEWVRFPDLVINYWNDRLPLWEKQALAVNRNAWEHTWTQVTDPVSTAEGNIILAFAAFPLLRSRITWALESLFLPARTRRLQPAILAAL